MPRRAGGELALLEEHRIRPAELGEVIETATADRAATDDQYPHALDHETPIEPQADAMTRLGSSRPPDYFKVIVIEGDNIHNSENNR
jgi:hypothetical protein